MGGRLLEAHQPAKRVGLLEYTRQSKEIHKKFQNLADTVRGFEGDEFSPFYGKAKPIVDPQESLAAKILAIREAKYSIDLSYYIFKNDESGQLILEELRKALKRGVRVRMFIDAFGSFRQLPFYTKLRALQSVKGGMIRTPTGEMTNERAQLDIVIFNPIHIARKVKTFFKKVSNLFRSPENKFTFSGGSPNRRAHDKMLLVDAGSPKDALAIVGGRNIANEYYNIHGRDKSIKDMEMIFRANQHHPTDAFRNQLEHYYNRMFFHASMLKLRKFLFRISPRNMKKTLRELRLNKQKAEKVGDVNQKVKNMQEGQFLNAGFDEGEIKFMHELNNITRKSALAAPFVKDNGYRPQSIMANIKGAIKKADKTIDIVSPYVWLKKDEIKFLHRWVKDDPERKVRIVTNSMVSTDSILVQAMIDSVFAPKLISPLKDHISRNQIQLFSYGDQSTETQMLHAKYVVIDEKEAFVTTSNFDPRSRYLNTEIGVSFKPLKAGEKTSVDELVNYTDELSRDSVVWGSDKWKELRNDPRNRIPRVLQDFAAKLIRFFRLEPML